MKSKPSESMKEKKSSIDEEEDASAYFARLAEENE
jgi:hypothetical protein